MHRNTFGDRTPLVPAGELMRFLRPSSLLLNKSPRKRGGEGNKKGWDGGRVSSGRERVEK